MMKFTKAGPGEGGRGPEESGMYVVVIITRDGHKVLRTLGYDTEADYPQKWIRYEVGEYGYLEVDRIEANYIHAWSKLEGIDLNIVPETISISIEGLVKDEDD